MTGPQRFVGYMMAAPDWAPPERTKASWVYLLPALYYALPDAQAESGNPYSAPRRPYKVTVTFEPAGDEP